MPERLRVLFISSAYPPESGDSIYTWTMGVAEGIAARGHDVHVLSCAEDQAERDYVDRGVRVHLRGLVRVPGLKRVAKMLHAPQAARRVRVGLSTFMAWRQLGLDFDVIEYPDWEAEGLVFALLHRKRLVADLHSPLPVIHRYEGLPSSHDAWLASLLERVAVHGADAVVAPSHIMVRTIQDFGWLRGRDVRVILTGLDWQRWSDVDSIRDTPPTVLFAGWLGRLKAPEVLVEAMSLVRKDIPDARAVFAGSSPGISRRDGLPYLEWMRRSMLDMSGCRFVGHVPRQELAHLLAASRVLAVPSRFDNFPLVALEAMAAGRPVVVTSTTGVAPLVEETRSGRVVAPGDPQELAQALLPFLRDVHLAAETGERGRTAIQTTTDPHIIAEEREALYRDMCASRGHRLTVRDTTGRERQDATGSQGPVR